MVDTARAWRCGADGRGASPENSAAARRHACQQAGVAAVGHRRFARHDRRPDVHRPVCPELGAGNAGTRRRRQRRPSCADASWTREPESRSPAPACARSTSPGSRTRRKCPIGDCEIVVDRAAGRIPIYRITAGADGRFNIPGVKPGDYLVAAVAPGYVQRYFGQTSDDMPEMSVHVAAGERAPSIDVRLEPAGSVERPHPVGCGRGASGRRSGTAAPRLHARRHAAGCHRVRADGGHGASSRSAMSRRASTTSARTRHHRSRRRRKTRPSSYVAHVLLRSDRHRVRAAGRPRQRPGTRRRGLRAGDGDDAHGERPAGRSGWCLTGHGNGVT